MATSGGVCENEEKKRLILEVLPRPMRLILNDIEIKPKDEVCENICIMLEGEFIIDIRNQLFKLAVEKLGKQTNHQIRGLNLEMCQRRGDKAKDNNARDIYELFCYVADFYERFPKDVLSKSSKSVDLSVFNTDNGQAADTSQVGEDISNRIDPNLQIGKPQDPNISDINIEVTKLKFRNGELEEEVQKLKTQVILMTEHYFSAG